MRSKILYSLLAVFAATCLFSSVAKERLHKLVIDSEEDFYEYPDRWKAHINSSLYSGQPVVNDIDSITFDVGKQQMSIFSSTPKSNSLITATYNLTKLKGFSFSYLDDGKMPTTMVGYASDSDNVNSVFLTWRPVEGASGYEIAFAKEPYYTKMDRFDWITDPSTLHITVSADSTEHKFDNLFFGASYRAAVKVLSPDGKAYDSEWSIRPNFKSYLVNGVEDDILRFTISDNPIWTDTKGVLSVKEADGNSLLLEIASPESEEWAGVDLSGIEIENGKFVFDKILVNAFPGEKEHFTEVSPADIAAGQIKIELPEGYSRYEISAYTSHLRPCYAAYGSLSYKPDYLERGFMLLGTDGTTDNTVVGMLSMKTDGDTVMIDRALTFDGMFHKPRKLYYSGSYIDSYGEALWILGEEESWKISAADATDCPALQPLGTFSSLIPYGTINSPVHVDDDEQAVDIFPKRAPGGGNLYRSVSLAITDKACYGPEMTISGKGFFFQPVNRMANTPDSPLFNFYPSFFYNGSLTYMSWTSTPFYIYDTDNDRFVKITVTGLNGTHCQVLPDNSFAAWRWDCKSENRSLVYGQNTATPDKGYSYFIMRSTADDNVFDIYSLHIPSSYTQNKEKFAVDLSLAKDFDKASMYTFIGCRRAVFYSVGSVLHQYDFEKGLHTAMDLGAEITMIKPEYYSVNRQDDLMVATWDSSASQGSFMKLRIGSDPAKVEMNIRNDFDNAKYLEKWTTRIKIVDAEWFSR